MWDFNTNDEFLKLELLRQLDVINLQLRILIYNDKLIKQDFLFKSTCINKNRQCEQILSTAITCFNNLIIYFYGEKNKHLCICSYSTIKNRVITLSN